MASPDQQVLLGERIARQGLADRHCTTVPGATQMTTAIQAQDNVASRLGVRARAVSIREEDVVAAIEADRSVVRTWLMRGTIHLVAAADLRWLVRLIGPSVVRKFRTRWRQLGLTDDVLDRCVDALPEILADGPLNRHEIRAELGERGIVRDPPDPQAHTHALVYASAVGLVCRGPDRGRHSTFVLVDDWLPDAPAGPSDDEALAELARRYFRAYSPATTADFTTWSGLGGARAVALIRAELRDADVDGRPGYRLGAADPARGVRLLPAFDNYLIGYRDRRALLEPALHGRIYQGGLIRPSVVVDGRVAGSWTLERARRRVTITAFEDLRPAVRDQIGAEVDDVGRFLGCELTHSYA